MNLGQVILAGVVLGLTAAAVVWFLESHQRALLVSEIETWLAGREPPKGAT